MSNIDWDNAKRMECPECGLFGPVAEGMCPGCHDAHKVDQHIKQTIGEYERSLKAEIEQLRADCKAMAEALITINKLLRDEFIYPPSFIAATGRAISKSIDAAQKYLDEANHK